MRISPWWLLAGAVALGAALTGIFGAVGSEHLTPLDWLATTVGVAALVVTVGIYRLQESSGNEAHAELMDQLEAQNELLHEFAKRAAAKGGKGDEPDSLTKEQRAEVESLFGEDSIAAAVDPGRGRGGRGNARLVRLQDGRLVSVYTRRGHTYAREIGEPRNRRPHSDR